MTLTPSRFVNLLGKLSPLCVVAIEYVTFVTATLSEIDRKRRGSKTILNPAEKKGEAKNRIPNLISLLSIPECTKISSKEEFIY